MGGGIESLNFVYICLSLQKVDSCNMETGVRIMFEYHSVNGILLRLS